MAENEPKNKITLEGARRLASDTTGAVSKEAREAWQWVADHAAPYFKDGSIDLNKDGTPDTKQLQDWVSRNAKELSTEAKEKFTTISGRLSEGGRELMKVIDPNNKLPGAASSAAESISEKAGRNAGFLAAAGAFVIGLLASGGEMIGLLVGLVAMIAVVASGAGTKIAEYFSPGVTRSMQMTRKDGEVPQIVKAREPAAENLSTLKMTLNIGPHKEPREVNVIGVITPGEGDKKDKPDTIKIRHIHTKDADGKDFLASIEAGKDKGKILPVPDLAIRQRNAKEGEEPIHYFEQEKTALAFMGEAMEKRRREIEDKTLRAQGKPAINPKKRYDLVYNVKVSDVTPEQLTMVSVKAPEAVVETNLAKKIADGIDPTTMEQFKKMVSDIGADVPANAQAEVVGKALADKVKDNPQAVKEVSDKLNDDGKFNATEITALNASLPGLLKQPAINMANK